MKKIMVYGVSRSGTTLVWRMFAQLLPWCSIEKSHWDKVLYPCVIVYRDFRDALASNYRVNGLGLKGKWDVDSPPSRDTLDTYIDLYMDEHWPILQWYMKQHLEAPRLRYEDFYNAPEKIVAAVEQLSGEQISEATVDKALTLVSLDAASRRIAGMKDFREKDDESNLHGKHIGPVTPGSWKQWIAQSDHAYLTERLRPALVSLGYSLEA
jgi:hypothetical protein